MGLFLWVIDKFSMEFSFLMSLCTHVSLEIINLTGFFFPILFVLFFMMMPLISLSSLCVYSFFFQVLLAIFVKFIKFIENFAEKNLFRFIISFILIRKKIL